MALPDRGWLVMDGCRVATGRLPLLGILDRWRAPEEPVEALLLTHPHTDHAFGIRDVIETAVPRHIGLTTSPSSPAVVFAAFEAELAAASADSLEQLRRRVVLEAMLAIRRRFDAAPGDLLALVDGAQLPLTHRHVSAFVRAPDAALVHRRLTERHRGDPNELSAVVELVFGATRIVLGSDLPAVDSHGALLPAGWHAVLKRHRHLGDHHGLKIPHHGSPAAFHPDLMTVGRGRTWWISPFNRGKRLPPTGPDGLPRLVALNGEVSLTATPRARAAQPVHLDPAMVRVADLPSLFTAANPFRPDAFSVTPPAVEPLDAVWCGAFDDRGTLHGAWRGVCAFVVVP
ncbi:MAG TPA: MBL fold metallo-hydrolase [Kofleriaceae bacterium]|nr:MBL fold metallo-hydrolase [Kofleriaceae bacterium]